MQMNPVAESTRWVIAVLVLFGVWMAFILYVILSSPAQGTKSLGGFLLAIAVLNVLFYKSTGRRSSLPKRNPVVLSLLGCGRAAERSELRFYFLESESFSPQRPAFCLLQEPRRRGNARTDGRSPT